MMSDNSNRFFRGGCWYDATAYARVDYRFYVSPSSRSDYLGFRLVRTVKPMEQLAEVVDGQ